MIRTFLYLLSFTIILASCGENKSEKKAAVKEKDSKESIIAAIDSLKKKDDPYAAPNKAHAEKLIELYRTFAQKYPDDPKNILFQHDLSGVYLKGGNAKLAAQTLRDLIEKYPEHKLAEDWHFNLATILDTEFDERVEAKKFYQALVDKYPQSVYLQSVKSRLETIDSVSFNTLIERIENNPSAYPAQ